MNAICTKLDNQRRVAAALDKYNRKEIPLIITQLIWDRHGNSMRLQELYDRLRQHKYGWNWYMDEEVPQETEHEVQPGALTCHKCDNNRIVTRMQQTRGGDEGQTVYAWCIKCNNRWTCTN